MIKLPSSVAGAIVGGGVALLFAQQGGVPIPWASQEFESQVQDGLTAHEDRDSTEWGAEVDVAQAHIVHKIEVHKVDMIRDGSRNAL